MRIKLFELVEIKQGSKVLDIATTIEEPSITAEVFEVLMDMF